MVFGVKGSVTQTRVQIRWHVVSACKRIPCCRRYGPKHVPSDLHPRSDKRGCLPVKDQNSIAKIRGAAVVGCLPRLFSVITILT